MRRRTRDTLVLQGVTSRQRSLHLHMPGLEHKSRQQLAFELDALCKHARKHADHTCNSPLRAAGAPPQPAPAAAGPLSPSRRMLEATIVAQVRSIHNVESVWSV
jgi:hypothetical protein